MKEAEKKQIEELLKCLTYSTKTRNLAYNRKGETTFMQGSCIPRFKNDFKKLLNSFKIDPPEMSEAERKAMEYKPTECKYLVTLTANPSAPPVWECKTLQDVFSQTRSQTNAQQGKSPFTVVRVVTAYRKMKEEDWNTPELQEKWDRFMALKKDFG